jgi:hypothetical protein
MPSAKRGIWPALLLCWLVLGCMFAPGCSCEPERQAQSNNLTVCRSQHDKLAVFPRRTSLLELMPGTIPVSFGVTDTGESAVTCLSSFRRVGRVSSLRSRFPTAARAAMACLAWASLFPEHHRLRVARKRMAIDGTIREVDYSFEDAGASMVNAW